MSRKILGFVTVWRKVCWRSYSIGQISPAGKCRQGCCQSSSVIGNTSGFYLLDLVKNFPGSSDSGYTISRGKALFVLCFQSRIADCDLEICILSTVLYKAGLQISASISNAIHLAYSINSNLHLPPPSKKHL